MNKIIMNFIITVLLLSQINTVSAEISEWVQTSQSDFDAGEKVNLDTSSSPGDVLHTKDIDFNRLTIATGWGHTVGLKENGQVVAVGNNQYGQLNVANWRGIKAIAAGDYHTVGLKEDGKVVAVGDGSDGALNVADWRGIKAIATGGFHTVGLKEDGTVVAVGQNGYDQLNVTDWRNIKAIAAGIFHTVGLKEDGTVVAVGWNDNGQLNVADWRNIKAIDAATYRTAGLKDDGTVVMAGNACSAWSDWPTYICYVPLYDSNWSNIKAIVTGGTQTFGLKFNGTVVAIGDNYFGQLNVADWKNITAIASSKDSWNTVGLKDDGTVVATGDNRYGQLNVNDWKNIKQPSLALGNLISSVFDTQSASQFKAISWNATVPLEVGEHAVKFQVATNNDYSTWNFVGPDGTANTYYITSGQNIWQGHNGDRYIRYKLYLTTDNPNFTPTLHDVTIRYGSGNV